MDRRTAVAIDVVAAAGLFAVSAAVAAPTEPGAYVLLAAHTAPVAFRRRVPVTAVAVSLLAALAYAAAGYPEALTPATALTVYFAATSVASRPAWWLLGGAVVVSAITTTLGPGATDPSAPLLVAAAWQLGRSVRASRELTAQLARHAVTEERLRIARELHDIVAHSMSVVAVQAGSGRLVAEEDPAAARRALETIEDTTRGALREMRRMLGVLRDDDGADLAPAPGLADLDALAAELGNAGVPVDVRVEGEPRPLPPGVDLSAYRIVQEALTNVLKHAVPARATVVVRYAADCVAVSIDDDGRNAPSPTHRSGHGIAGMRERVAVHGGRLEAGPRPGGGFRVSACLPIA